jgi:hypothetical protein
METRFACGFISVFSLILLLSFGRFVGSGSFGSSSRRRRCYFPFSSVAVENLSQLIIGGRFSCSRGKRRRVFLAA